MLFFISRFVFFSIAFTISYIIIKKSHTARKQIWLIITFIMMIVLITVSSLIPIENTFLNFSTPESSYKYNNSGDVKLIVNGEKTDFIVGSKGDTDIYTIVPKADEGWKLGMGLDIKNVSRVIFNGISIHVYQYKNSNDYYITILDTDGGLLDITDTRNSEFMYLYKENDSLNKTYYTYYAYINGFDIPYSITVNDKEIRIQKSLEGILVTNQET